MSDIGAAVIGLGIGRQHVIGFDRTPGAQAVAVCDLSDEKLSAIKREYPGVDCVRDWSTLLQRNDIDLITVASFDDVHCDQVCRALDAGKHVFVEKPLCLTRGELHEVARRWQQRPECWIASNLVLRAAPLYQWLRDQIAMGRMGEIYAIDADYLYGRIHKITSGWRSEVAEYSVMMGGGIHMADLMTWLTSQRPTTVRARANSICTRKTSFRYPDFVDATYGFESGMVGRITANFGCVHRHQHVLRVFGTEATFLYDDQGPRWIASRDPSTPAEALDLDPLPPHKWALIPELVERIQRRERPEDRVRREFDLISLCLAADESVASDSELRIEYA